MADKTTTTDILKIELLFIDGDTRTLSLNNPRSNLTEADITALETVIATNNLFVGDKYGGAFKRIEKATKTRTVRTILDIA